MEKSPLCMKHYKFLKESLDDLNNDLENLGQSLIIEKASAIKVFKKYKEKYDLKTVWSHQETWNYWVKKRNDKLSEWFIENKISGLKLSKMVLFET